MAYYLFKTCDTCAGDGVVSHTYPTGSDTCWQCGGTGKVQTHEIDSVWASNIDDIFDKVKKIKKTVEDIWDKVNV